MASSLALGFAPSSDPTGTSDSVYDSPYFGVPFTGAPADQAFQGSLTVTGAITCSKLVLTPTQTATLPSAGFTTFATGRSFLIQVTGTGTTLIGSFAVTDLGDRTFNAVANIVGTQPVGSILSTYVQYASGGGVVIFRLETTAPVTNFTVAIKIIA